MVKKLRRKFVLTAMLSLLVIIICIIGVINVYNYVQIQMGADEILTILSENDGFFPDPVFMGMIKEEQNKTLNNQKNENDDKSEDGPPPFPEGEMFWGDKTNYNRQMEMPYQSRYFWVRLSEDGSVKEINTGHIAAISSSDAKSVATDIYESGIVQGYYDNHYRYLVKQNDNGEYLVMFVDCSRDFYNANRLLIMTVLIGIISLLAMFILVYMFSGKAVAPVVESLEKQKRFITDAGHELKTPIAVISANVDVLELESGKSEWTNSIRGQVKRMTELVKNMLTLSRMEEENIHVVFSDLNLSQTIVENSASFAAVADSKGLKYNLDIAEDIHILGDKNGINQLSSLLIDNAMKYSSENGSVNVMLSKDQRGKKAIFEVSNTCDSIPEGNLDRLFDRFYRADNSRSRDTGGYGIGLSVARAIANSHGGEIEAQRDGDHIIRFIVKIPVAKNKTN
ncbi:MAG: HAMP domain-containing histidine kinase [Butyrivibrio sp.]|nr:HAMP domain-containing histidine kinase [Butyrivibrio sp.]